jgi:hypothetical protein
MKRKGAIELSIGTIVIIVIAMSMLILGLVLVRTIFTETTDNVKELNEGVKAEIRSLFQEEDQRSVVRLTQSTAKMKQGQEFNIGFGIKNVASGETTSTNFKYQTVLDDPDILTKCGVSEQEALSWVRLGSGTLSIRPGQVESDLIVFNVPDDAPLCTTKYRIKIQEEGTSVNDIYTNPFFIVKIEGGGLF